MSRMTDYLYRRMTEHDNVRDVWATIDIGNRILITEIAGSYANFETSIVLFHRSILMDCLEYVGDSWSRRTILSHIALLDKNWSSKAADIPRDSTSLVMEKARTKMSSSEKRVYEMLFLFPSKPRAWVDRSLNYCHKIGISNGRLEKSFSLWLPNPYEKVDNAQFA